MQHLEIKSTFSVDDAGAVTGLAWPFASPDQAGDIIRKGAFAGVSRVPMLWQHEQGEVIGMWDDLAETEEGLEVKGRLYLDAVARAREAHFLVKEKAVTGLSIGFRNAVSTSRRNVRGRIITGLDLAELSLVTFPSHLGARITGAKAAHPANDDPHRVAEIITRAALALRSAA